MPAYADIDKNRAMIKGETMARRLAKFFADKGIGGLFRTRKHDYSISRDSALFARISEVTPIDVNIQWNMDVLRVLELDKTALATEFMASTDPQTQVSWG